MFFIRNFIKSYTNFIFLKFETRMSSERESELLRKILTGEIGDLGAKKEPDLDKITLDWKLTKSEIEEAKKIQYYNQDKLDIIFEMQDRFKEFINTEYRDANLSFLKSKNKTIKDLQSMLNQKLWLRIKEDNIFWKETFLTIINFQKENHLWIDWLIWPNSYKELFTEKRPIIKKINTLKKEKNNKTQRNSSWPDMLASNEKLSWEKIVKIAMKAVENWDIFWAKNCTDWVSKIWWKDVNTWSYVFKWKILEKDNGRWSSFIPEKYASKNIIAQIKPWNHILVDKPTYKRWRTHSIIALEKPNNWVVRVASYSWYSTPTEEIYDLYWKGRWDKDAKVARIHKLV